MWFFLLRSRQWQNHRKNAVRIVNPANTIKSSQITAILIDEVRIIETSDENSTCLIIKIPHFLGLIELRYEL